MLRHLRTLTLLSLLICVAGVVNGDALAQDSSTRNEFWPEVDVYINLKPKLRLFLLGTVSKSVEDGEILKADAFEAQVGIHLDYIANKYVTLRTGYRFGTSLGSDDEFKEHRVLTEQTLHKSLPWQLLLSDRNREDFRFVNGEFSFRYRNRLMLEKELELAKRSVRPYVFGEGFYDSRYDVWNRTRFGGGVQVALKPGPLMKIRLPEHQTVLDIYYMRQHDTRSSTRHVNGFGAVVAFYF